MPRLERSSGAFFPALAESAFKPSRSSVSMSKIGALPLKVTVPFRAAADNPVPEIDIARYRTLTMLRWDSITAWGRRASDVGATPPVSPIRDLILEAAIAHEQVELLFQPIIDVATGRIAGAEALARSAVENDAQALFARADAAALGERLSRLVQHKALCSAAVWEGPLKDLRVSINLLPADISRSGYERWLLDEIGAAGIDPRRVTLEITESALLADRESVAARLATLRQAGLRIAVDDFGTGYASLAYLTSL